MIFEKVTVHAADPEEEEEDEEEMVDPHDVLKETCQDKPECSGVKNLLSECNDRVNSRSQTTETCFEELVDLLGCVDHCVSHNLKLI